MYKVSERFDPESVEWRNYKDSSCKEFRIDFDYSLLGYDINIGRLDMMLRYPKNMGHCRRHRHIASTLTLVLEGEQYLIEQLEDGTKKNIYRKKGDYAFAAADALPHLEHGGPNGGIVLLSMQAQNDLLFEYFDENMENAWKVTIDQYIKSWNTNLAYGLK